MARPVFTRPRERRVAAALRRTPAIHPFRFDAFAAELTTLTGAPVQIRPSTTLPAFVAGRWHRGAHGDLIEFDPRLPETARIGTVLHEAGHILCGHTQPDEQLDYDAALCTVIGRDAAANFQVVRYRSVYRTRFEREAELYARRALNAIMHLDDDSIAAQVRASLGHPRLERGLRSDPTELPDTQ